MTTQPERPSPQDEARAERPTKALVVYYSRTGYTGIVAEAIAQRLGCDLEEIVDRKRRRGPLGILLGAKDALDGKLTEIEPIRHDPETYDLVVIGGPVWAGTMAPAVRTYMTEQAGKMKKVAFFCTQSSAKPGHTFADMQALGPGPPVDTLSLRTKAVKRRDFDEKLDGFVDRLRAT